MYYFVLGYPNDEKNLLYFPIAPEKLTTEYQSSNTVIETVKNGEFSILKDMKLRNLSFKVLLTEVEEIMEKSNLFKEPLYYLAKLREFRANKKPLIFIINRLLENGTELFDGNLWVSLEDVTTEENAGEEGSFWVDIKLKEYRALTPKVLTINKKEDAKGKVIVKENITRPAKEPNKIYKVKKGDTLWKIASRELGNGEKYKEIAKFNNITDTNKIKVGMVLRLKGG